MPDAKSTSRSKSVRDRIRSLGGRIAVPIPGSSPKVLDAVTRAISKVNKGKKKKKSAAETLFGK
jgi:hypothetical protein